MTLTSMHIVKAWLQELTSYGDNDTIFNKPLTQYELAVKMGQSVRISERSQRPGRSGVTLVVVDLAYVLTLISLGVNPARIAFMSYAQQHLDEASQMGISELYFVRYNSSMTAEERSAAIDTALQEGSQRMYFGIIIGNPPYQNANSKARVTMWELYIRECTKHLTDDGVMSFIVPPGWCSFSDTMEFLLKENIVTAEINTKALCDSFAGVGSQFSTFIIDRTAPYSGCKVITDTGSGIIDYRTTRFIPLSISASTMSLMNGYSKIIETFGRQEIQWGCGRGQPSNMPSNTLGVNQREISKSCWANQPTSGYSATAPTSTHINPSIRTFANWKKQLFGWSELPGLAANFKKVIFTDAKNSVPFYDDGKYGVGEHCRAILVNSAVEADMVIEFLTHPVIQQLGNLVPASGSWGGIAAVILIFGLPKIIPESLIELRKLNEI